MIDAVAHPRWEEVDARKIDMSLVIGETEETVVSEMIETGETAILVVETRKGVTMIARRGIDVMTGVKMIAGGDVMMIVDDVMMIAMILVETEEAMVIDAGVEDGTTTLMATFLAIVIETMDGTDGTVTEQCDENLLNKIKCN